MDDIFKEASGAVKRLYGIYRGKVEYVNDPLQSGRVKVRIPVLHSTEKVLPTDLLPWAVTMSSFGGGYDYGSKHIYPAGSTVFVMFEGGDPDLPVVIGSWEGNSTSWNIMLRDSAGEWPKGPISMSPQEDIPWFSPPGADSPKEYLLMSEHSPERYVPFKSVKGATIDIEDRDEVEHTRIVDRAGQGLFFDSPIIESGEDGDPFPANEDNQAQRGLRTAQEGDQLPLESTLASEASITLVDINSQSITLHSSENGNNIQLISKQPEQENNLTLGRNKELPGEYSASLELSSGYKVINLDITNNGISLARISLDGNVGTLFIDAPTFTKINSESIVLSGDVKIEGNLVVTDTVTCLGDGTFSGEVLKLNNLGKQEINAVAPPTPEV